jgi:hypothetical protein
MGKYTLESQKRTIGENTELFEILPSAVLDLASGGNRDIEVISNPKAYGAIVIVKLDAEVGTAGVTPQLFINDEDGNNLVIRSEAELTASGTYVYVYAPGATTGGYNGVGVTMAVDIHLPREWGFRLNKSTGNTGQTFTAEAHGVYLL